MIVTGPELSRIRTDTIVGMGISNLIALCIIFATAATLNANGVTEIQTSAQAAEALRGTVADVVRWEAPPTREAVQLFYGLISAGGNVIISFGGAAGIDRCLLSVNSDLHQAMLPLLVG